MAEDDASREELRRLIERLENLEHVLRMHTERLYQLERRARIDFQPAAQPRKPLYESIIDERDETNAPPSAPTAEPQERESTPPPNAPPQPQPSTHAQGASGGDGRGVPFGGSVYSARPNESRTQSVKRARDVESLVGGSWFNWLGIIAITFGVAFFLKYAFDNHWINPTARVTLGAAAGLAIIILADRLRARGFRQYAYVLTGGGVLILYLSTYAARAFYDLIGQTPAFLLMSAVTAVAVALAVRHDATAIAILGLIGGFATPVLLSTGEDKQAALFTYLALLDAGVLAVAYFKRWRVLNFLAFFATVITFVGWMEQHYRTGKLWPTIFFLTLFFLLFSALAPVHNVLAGRPARWHDILLIVVNATFYFGLSYLRLDEAGYHAGLSSFALAVSALYVLLFYMVWTRNRADLLLRYSYVGAAVTFFTMAVAIQLDWHWVTIAWATEALMLVWVGLRARESAPRHAALLVFAIALAHWLVWDVDHSAFRPETTFVPLLNARAFSAAALVSALLAGAWLYRRAGAEVEESERKTASAFYTLAATGLGLVLLTLDVNDYFNQLAVRAAEDDIIVGRSALENTRQFSLTVLWTFYGAALLLVGLLRRMRLLRYAGVLLLVYTVFKLLAVDSRYYDAPWHLPIFNQTFAAYALMTCALAFCARFYARYSEHTPAGERAVMQPTLTVFANLLAVAALSLEASGHFESMIREGGLSEMALRDTRLASNLSLSVIWALYGGAMLAYGHVRGNKLLRVMALALLGLTTLKVFFWDLASLEKIYRIISFVLLGLILLAVSYLYQKRLRASDAAEAAEAEPSQ